MAVAALRREVSAAEEGFEIRSEPDRHRPPTAAGGGLHEGHIDAVDVGPFFAVPLDRNVILVEPGGDLLVLERFPLHDVAPVARRIADRKENRLVLDRERAGYGERVDF